MQNEKKPWVAPTLIDHGDAVEETKGFCGEMWEYHGNLPIIDDD